MIQKYSAMWDGFVIGSNNTQTGGQVNLWRPLLFYYNLLEILTSDHSLAIA